MYFFHMFLSVLHTHIVMHVIIISVSLVHVFYSNDDPDEIHSITVEKQRMNQYRDN